MSVNLYNPTTGELTQIAGNSSGGGQTIQLTKMPTASSTYAGKVYQYIGASDSNFTNGLFYKCVESSGTYSWQNLSTVKAPKSSYVATSSLADDDVYSAKLMNSQLGIGKSLNTIAQNHAEAINELNSQLVQSVTFTPDSTKVTYFNYSAYQIGKMVVLNLWCFSKNAMGTGSVKIGSVNKLPAFDYVQTERNNIVIPAVSSSTGTNIGVITLIGSSGDINLYLSNTLEASKSINGTLVYKTS